MPSLGKLLAVFLCCCATVQMPARAQVTYVELGQAIDATEWTRLDGFRQRPGVSPPELDAEIMISAAQRGRTDVIEKLMARGVKVDTAPRFNKNAGENALMHAAARGQLGTVRWLLERGADAKVVGRCNKPECGGHTALNGAIDSDSVEIVKALLKAGADPNLGDGIIVRKADFTANVAAFELLTAHGGRCTLPHPFTIRAKANGEEPATAPLAAPAYQALGITELLPEKADTTPRAAAARTRLAIVTDESHEAVGAALTAQLTATPGLELVERHEIDRLLAEQKLTRTLAADAASAAKLGAWLQADALVLIRAQTLLKAKVVETRLVRTAPGAVLETFLRPAPLADPAAWAATLTPRVVVLATHARQRDALAVSVTGVRASLGTPAALELERTATVLLQHRLARTPGVLLLERSGMDRLAAETAAGGSDFWKARYLVESTLDLDSAGAERFRCTVRLQPAGGGAPLEGVSEGTRADIAVAVDAALRAALSRVQGEPGPAGDSDHSEAQRFLDEARANLTLELYTQALEAADSAWALGLRTRELTRLQIDAAFRLLVQQREAINGRFPDLDDWANRALFRHPRRRTDCPEPAEWLAIAIRALECWRTEFANGDAADPAAERAWLEVGETALQRADAAISAFDTAEEILRHRPRLEQLRRTRNAALAEALAGAVRLGDEARDISLTKLAVTNVALWHETPEAVLAALRQYFGRHFPTDDAATRLAIRYHVHVRLSSYGTSLSKQTKAFLGRALKEAPEPDDRLVGRLFAHHSASSVEEHAQAERAAMTLLREMMPVRMKDEQWFQMATKMLGHFERLESSLNPARPLVKIIASQSPQTMGFSAEYRAYRMEMMLAALDRGAPLAALDPWWKPESHLPEEVAKLRDAILPRLQNPSVDETPVHQNSRIAWLRRLDLPVPDSLGAKRSFTPATPRRTASPLRVAQYWNANESAANAVDRVQLDFQRARMMPDGTLWVVGTATDINAARRVVQRFLFHLDPDTRKAETIAMPESPRMRTFGPIELSGGHFVVTPERIHVLAYPDYLATYDRRLRSWKVNRDYKPTEDEWVADERSVYFVQREPGSDTLHRWNLESNMVELLASTRRRPAQTPLDDPEIYYKSPALRDGTLVISAAPRVRGAINGLTGLNAPPAAAPGTRLSGKSWAWNAAAGKWEEPPRMKLPSQALPVGPRSTYVRLPRMWDRPPGPDERPELDVSDPARKFFGRVPLEFAASGEGSASYPVSGPVSFGFMTMHQSPNAFLFGSNQFDSTIWILRRADLEAHLDRLPPATP